MADQVHTRSALREGVPVSGESVTFTAEALVTVAEYDAVGGPQFPKDDGRGRMKKPTVAGEYMIVGSWKHVSKGQWAYSLIKWGSPLRENNGKLEVSVEGVWEPLSKYVSDSREKLIEEYKNLYKKNELPTTWVFNDFGHITCYMTVDLDRDGVWDEDSEKIHNQFFHPTPIEEGLTAQNELSKIELKESHGCIHVKPNDIDEMIAKGYMKKGNIVYVYEYTSKPFGSTGVESAHAPYSLHFYPGIKKLFVQGHK